MADIGTIIGSSVYDPEDIRRAIEENRNNLSQQEIERLEEYAGKVEQRQEEKNITPLGVNPEYTYSDLGGGGPWANLDGDEEGGPDGVAGAAAKFLLMLIVVIPLAVLAYAFGQLFNINLG